MQEICLNLGCGEFPFDPPYINIDLHDLRDRDPEGWQDCNFQQHDLTKGIPFPDASINQIHIGYMLSMISNDDGVKLLRESLRVLEPGGRLVIFGLGVNPNALDHPARLLHQLEDMLGFDVAEVRTALADSHPEAPLYVGGTAPEHATLIGYEAVKTVIKEFIHAA